MCHCKQSEAISNILDCFVLRNEWLKDEMLDEVRNISECTTMPPTLPLHLRFFS